MMIEGPSNSATIRPLGTILSITFKEFFSLQNCFCRIAPVARKITAGIMPSLQPAFGGLAMEAHFVEIL